MDLNEPRTRLRPVANGIDFLGYVVHPDHCLVRRRVVGNFRARLGQLEQRLTRPVPRSAEPGEPCRPEWRLYRYPEASLEGLLSSTNSYLAHLRRANTVRLVRKLWSRFPWMKRYVALDGYKVQRRWLPSGKLSTVAEQWSWFRSVAGHGILFFQVGHSVVDSRDNHRFPRRRLREEVRAAMAARVPITFVAETGQWFARAVERRLVWRLVPVGRGIIESMDVVAVFGRRDGQENLEGGRP